MEDAEDGDFVGIGGARLVDDDIGEPAHHPLMRARDAAGVPHSREFGKRSAVSRMRATTCVAATGLRLLM